MRIAVIPFQSITNTKSSTDMNAFLNWIRVLNESHDDLYWYVLAPPRWLDSSLPEVERVSFLPSETGRDFDFYEAMISVGPETIEYFSPLRGTIPIDLFWTNKSSAAAMLAKAASIPSKGCAIPVVVNEFKAMDHRLTSDAVYDEEMVMRCLGYSLGYGCFGTEVERDIAVGSCRRYLSSFSLSRMMSRSNVFRWGVDIERLDRLLAETPLRERFTLFYGGRLNNASKNVAAMFEVYKKFWEAHDIEVLVTSPTSWRRVYKYAKRNKYATFIGECSPEEYMRLMASSHVIFRPSMHEGYTPGAVEMMYMKPTVLPERYWVRGLLGEMYDKYPFLYTDLKEAYAEIRWIYENYDDAVGKMEPIREFIRENDDVEVCAENWLSKMRGIVEETFVLVKKKEAGARTGVRNKSMPALMRQVLADMPRVFKFSDFCSTLSERSDVQKWTPERGLIVDPSRKVGWSNWHAYKWLCMHARDLCDGPEPRFEKLEVD